VVKAGTSIQKIATTGLAVAGGVTVIVGIVRIAYKLNQGQDNWPKDLIYSIIAFVLGLIGGLVRWNIEG
jgi:hypothetical protein